MRKQLQNKPYRVLGLTIMVALIVLYGVVFSVDAWGTSELSPNNLGHSGFCYQESANVTNQSGKDTCSDLRYTGVYGINGSFNSPENFTDGNWSSSAGAGVWTYYYVSYIPPQENLLGSKITRAIGTTTISNDTLDTDCLKNSLNKVVIRYSTEAISTTTNIHCYSQAHEGFLLTTTSATGNNNYYEDAIYWNVSNRVNENLSFDNFGNITRYIKIPSGVPVTDAYMNLSSYNTIPINQSNSHETMGYYPSGHCQSFIPNGTFINEAGFYVNQAIGADWWNFTMFLNNETNCANCSYYPDWKRLVVSDLVYVNQTGRLYTINVTVPINLSANYSLCIMSAGSPTIHYNSTSDYYANGKFVYNDGAPNTWKVVDWDLSFYVGYNLYNPSMSINNTNIWNYTGAFNQTNNKTANFASAVNNYLSSCSYINGYCYVPLVFHSDIDGRLLYSGINIDSQGIVLDTIAYNKKATSGSTQPFMLNITYDSSLFTGLTAYLTYNNTNYTAITSGSGNTRILTATLIVPIVTNTINKTFYMDIGLTNTTGTYYYQTPAYTQELYNMTIDNCTVADYQIFNITLFDEDSLGTYLNGTSQNSSIEVQFNLSSLNSLVPIYNYSNIFNKTNPARICFGNDIGSSKYRLDGVIKYSTTGRFNEFYYIQNYTLTNTTSNITLNLYDLLTTTGQEFKITYKDENFVPLTNAVLDIQRKYISEGVFRTIERPKTGLGGYTTGHLIVNDAIYNILVYKEGQLIATFEDITASCQIPTLNDCEININSYGTSTSLDDYSNYNDLSFAMNYEQSTRTVSSIFSVTSGVPATMLLNVTLFDNTGVTQVCNNSLYAAGGTLSCIVPISFGNGTVISTLYKNGARVGYSLMSLKEKPATIYGHNVIFLAMVIFLIFLGIGAGSDSPTFFGIVIILGSFVLVGLNLLYTPSLSGMGSTVLWFIICVALVLVKGSYKE